MKTAPTSLLWPTSFLISSTNNVAADSVDLLDRYPNWQLVNNLFVSRWLIIWVNTALSIIFGNMGSIDIGLKLLTLSALHFEDQDGFFSLPSYWNAMLNLTTSLFLEQHASIFRPWIRLTAINQVRLPSSISEISAVSGQKTQTHRWNERVN